MIPSIRIPWMRRLLNRLQTALPARLKKWPPTARLVARVRRTRIVQSLYDLPSHRIGDSWSSRRECPSALLDAQGAKVGDRLYVIGGYSDIAHVSDKIFVFDLGLERWVETIDPPVRLAHSHMAACSDGVRFIYAVSGQLGAQCRPAITDSFSFDTLQRIWRELPALPAPRYAGTLQLLGNRLHFVGGAMPDRYTPASDHWSLAVEEGRANESSWREETPVPRPAMHRGSAAIGNSLYVFGGQQGDFVAIDGDPNYTCTGRTRETYFADTYRFNPDRQQWTRLRDMPVPVSHTDFSVVAFDQFVHVIGGQVYKHPGDFGLRLTDLIQTYDLVADRWSISGYLPYRLKLPICAIHRDHLYCFTGQRDVGSANDSPGRITANTWRASLSSLGGCSLPPDRTFLPKLDGKDVALISHGLTLTGAPLMLIEIARAMQDSGANVRLFTLANDNFYGSLAERYCIPVLPIETSAAWAARADLVIANTTVAGPWIRDYLAAHPSGVDRLIWWNHENSIEKYGHYFVGTDAIRMMVFDSLASQMVWEASGLPLPPHRMVVHPGIRKQFWQAAETGQLPWPGSAKHERVSRDVARRRLGIRKNDFLLLCMGTVMLAKGQLLLLRTVGGLLAQYPNLPIRLLLVGFNDEAHCRETLSALSPMERRAVLNGRLLWVQQAENSIFYKSADAFVMNSQGNGEPFGLVTIEAMAFGLPVLGTNAGGTKEIVLDGITGLLHPVGEEGSQILGSNILHLENARDDAMQLGAAGKERASKYFTSHRFFRDLEDALANVQGGAVSWSR